jgi:hypothetical protein
MKTCLLTVDVVAWGADGVGRLQVQHGKKSCSTHRIWRIAEYVYGGSANDLRLTSMMSALFARANSSHLLSKLTTSNIDAAIGAQSKFCFIQKDTVRVK